MPDDTDDAPGVCDDGDNQPTSSAARIRAAKQTVDAAMQVLAATRALLDDVAETERSRDDVLVDAKARPFGLTPNTFRRWANEERFPSMRAERRRIVAWRSDVRRAIEARRNESSCTRDIRDPLETAIKRGQLRRRKK